ncbi:MAG: polysaccharide biosynthesis tyrosine autokinase [Anaerolineae bacterium]
MSQSEMMQNQAYIEDDISIDIQYYFYLLRANLLFIILVLIGTLLVTVATNQLITPTYSASTTIFVNSNTSSANELNSIRASESLAQTIAQMAVSRDILAKLIEDLDLATTPGSLKGAISAGTVSNTQLIQITVEHEDALLASSIANKLVEVLIARNAELQTAGFVNVEENLLKQLDLLETQIAATEDKIANVQFSDANEQAQLNELLIQYNRDQTALLQSYEAVRLEAVKLSSNLAPIESAVPNENPIRPRPLINLMLASAVGLMLSVGFILLRDFLDSSVKDFISLSQKLGLGVIGQIPWFSAENADIFTINNHRSPVAEAFRSLRQNLKFASVDRPLKSLMITSPSPAEGKSTTAANLAGAIASSGQSVLLIDGDLRRPKTHTLFDLPNNYGMSNLFLEPLDNMQHFFQNTSAPNLKVLTSGPLPPNPSELFDTKRAQQIIQRALTMFDMVIIDAPPVLGLADSTALSQYMDGVMFNVMLGKSHENAVYQAINRLKQVNANLVGLNVVGLDNSVQRGGYYYYIYSSYYDQYFNAEEQPAKHWFRPQASTNS